MKQIPRVIVFDAFGTLVKIGSKKSPYRKLMKWLKNNGRKPSLKDSSHIMANPFDIAQLCQFFQYDIPSSLLNEINDDLNTELKTIELFEDSVSSLSYLKNMGYKIALCSNLAMPYGERLKELLPHSLFDGIFFSYEVGAIKPEPEIFHTIRDFFDCKMSDILFIGDNLILDVEGPKSVGMDARLIQRHTNEKILEVVGDLT